jgi:hypothetical protein
MHGISLGDGDGDDDCPTYIFKAPFPEHGNGLGSGFVAIPSDLLMETEYAVCFGLVGRGETAALRG